MRAVLFALVLLGCASEPWYRIGPQLPSVWITVEELAPYCRGLPPGVIACAHRDQLRGTCFIYATTPEHITPDWIVGHEQKHCDGFHHG